MADENETAKPDEIEQLLNQSGQGGLPEQSPDNPASDESPTANPLGQDEIESLLNEAPSAAEDADAATSDSTHSTQTAQAVEAGDGDALLAQEEINELLTGAGTTPSAQSQSGAAHVPTADESQLPQGDIECLFDQAQQALDSIDSVSESEVPSGVVQFRFQEFAGAPPNTESTTLDLISDVELDLKIELGQTQMYLEDVLKLRRGSVVTLDKLAGDPVDIYVNGRLIARGEVLVLNDNFCVRVAELVAGASFQ